MPTVWKLGASPGPDPEEYIPKALKYNFVSLGWAGTGDVGGKTIKGIASILRDTYPGRYTRDKLQRNARDLWRFTTIAERDYVVLYHLYRAYVGRVTKPYYWIKDESPTRIRIFEDVDYCPHRLGVEWLFHKKPVKVDLSNLRHKIMSLSEESFAKIKPLNEILKNARVEMPVDYGKPAGKAKSIVTRFIRDTVQSRKLKEKYGDQCQVCGEIIRKGDGSSYSVMWTPVLENAFCV
jgi:hypothetical protein